MRTIYTATKQFSERERRSSMQNTNSKWSEERLEKLRVHYEHILQKAIISNTEEHKRLSGITRRARKRLAKLGIIMLDQPGGKAKYFQPKSSLAASEDPDLVQTKQIVSYINHHDLVYGTTLDNDPTWAICVNTYRLK